MMSNVCHIILEVVLISKVVADVTDLTMGYGGVNPRNTDVKTLGLFYLV